MPITRQQFQQGLNDKIEEWMGRIKGFLQQHKDEAFTEQELRVELGLPYYEDPPSEAVMAFGWALDLLLQNGDVESRIVGHTHYYALSLAPNPQK